MTDWTAAPEPYQPTVGTGVFRSAQALGVAAMIGIGVVMILDVVTMLETVHLVGWSTTTSPVRRIWLPSIGRTDGRR